MFLNSLLSRNPALVDFAIEAHQNGQLPPDCYVIDLDVMIRNAKLLSDVANKNGIELFQVFKQLGRSRLLMDTVAEYIPKAAVIDYREASQVIGSSRTKLGNVGHLVQIPRRQLPTVLSNHPDYVTVYDRANLVAVQEAARGLCRQQSVLVKVASCVEDVYPGQHGGFLPEEVPALLEELGDDPFVRIAGFTAFPCFLYDSDLGRPRPTATLQRVVEVAKYMENPVLDLPSHTSVSTIPMIAAAGGSIGEPGHALTGTTPENAENLESAELPAILYLSEVAQAGDELAVFGGGFYPRGHAKNLLGVSQNGDRWNGVLVDEPAENIDYYRRFSTEHSRPALGDTAIMSFRTQIFVTRSLVAVVRGIQSGRPEIVGLFDSAGTPLDVDEVVL